MANGYIPTANLQDGDKVTGPGVKAALYFGVEIKSKSGYGADTKYIRPKKNTTPTDFRPADEHILQALTYLYACRTLPALQKYKITKWFIVYVLRENGKIGCFEIEMTDFDSPHGFGYPVIFSELAPNGFIYKRVGMQQVIARWEELNFCLDHNLLPDRDYQLVYSPATLSAMLAAGSEDLTKDHKEKIASGDFSQCVAGKGTVNQRALGDFECFVCPFKSKCWGCGSNTEGAFKILEPGYALNKTKYSIFDPFKSPYFDRLTDNQKTKVRTEHGV